MHKEKWLFGFTFILKQPPTSHKMCMFEGGFVICLLATTSKPCNTRLRYKGSFIIPRLGGILNFQQPAKRAWGRGRKTIDFTYVFQLTRIQCFPAFVWFFRYFFKSKGGGAQFLNQSQGGRKFFNKWQKGGAKIFNIRFFFKSCTWVK